MNAIPFRWGSLGLGALHRRTQGMTACFVPHPAVPRFRRASVAMGKGHLGWVCVSTMEPGIGKAFGAMDLSASAASKPAGRLKEKNEQGDICVNLKLK